MKEIRVGIIGCGMISHRHMTIYENINRLSKTLGFSAKIVAVAEINQSRLKDWGAKYGLDEKEIAFIEEKIAPME
jgi:predicted dehydrogenase